MIHQHHAWPVDEHAREADALLHTTGELGWEKSA